MTRKINQATRAMIEAEEGCPLFAYDDAVYPPRPARLGEPIRGTLTIGAGHTGLDVYAGKTITQAQADTLLDADLAVAEVVVETAVKVPLSDDQFGALVSFTFNVGSAAFRGSTLLRKLNAGGYNAVPAELAKWNHKHEDGKLVVSNGLTKRRADEAKLWTGAAARDSGSVVAKPAPKTAEPNFWQALLAAILSFLNRKV